MTGDQFLAALSKVIDPTTVIGMDGKTDRVIIRLSDGRVIEAKRKEIAKLSNADQMAEYVKKVTA